MSTQLLSFRHYSAIRTTLREFVDSNRPEIQAYVWPLVNLQRESGKTFGQMMDYLDLMLQSMYEVNRIAYEYDNDDTCDIEQVTFEQAPVLSPMELFKALEAWRYNSVYTLEGEDIILSIPEQHGKAMYLACDVLHTVAEKIVKSLHEYEKAAWTL